MKINCSFVLLLALVGCASGAKQEVADSHFYRADPRKWDWEFHGEARAFGWYRQSISVALPEEISKASLAVATLEEITKAEAVYEKRFGAHWVPFSYFYRDGDTLWWWTGINGRRGFLIKSKDEIKAWRFVHYGPY